MRGKDKIWTSRGCPISHKGPGGVMGIINVTADSFYAGSRTPALEDALERCMSHLGDGADVLDIGAESSRPGTAPVSAEEELGRLSDLVGQVRARAPQAIISVDTYHAKTAQAVLESGADIINDISAATFEPELLDVLVQYKPGYVLMHCLGKPRTMQVSPSYTNVAEEIARFFEHHLNRLVQAGFPEQNVLLDPGIGFGKTMEHNLTLMRGTAAWEHLGRPSLMGCSMKSVFGDLLGLDTVNRALPTNVATALTFCRGYEWHRVHFPREASLSLQLAGALMQPMFPEA